MARFIGPNDRMNAVTTNRRCTGLGRARRLVQQQRQDRDGRDQPEEDGQSQGVQPVEAEHVAEAAEPEPEVQDGDIMHIL